LALRPRSVSKVALAALKRERTSQVESEIASSPSARRGMRIGTGLLLFPVKLPETAHGHVAWV
jgi:hypothetical protein